MATPLRTRLDDLASAFASGVLAAIRGASLEDLLSETSQSAGRSSAGRAGRAGSSRSAAAAGPVAAALPAAAPRLGKKGRLARRSATDIAGVIERIVGLLKQSPRGLRAEQIRARLGLVAKEMPRPLKEGLAAGRLAKSGQKRSTTYFAKGGGAPAAPAAKAAGSKKAPARRGRGRKASAAPKPARARKASKAKAKAKAPRAPKRGKRSAKSV